MLRLGKIYLIFIIILLNLNCYKKNNKDLQSEDLFGIIISNTEKSSNAEAENNENTSSETENSEPVNTTNLFIDTIPPIVGNNGIITINRTLHSSINISWTIATDETSKSENLKYSIYYSLADNINTIENIKNNGTLLNSIQNATSYSITNLSSFTKYFINIIAVDEAGNGISYSSISKKTSSKGVFLYYGNFEAGNLGGRTGIDNTCQSVYDYSIAPDYNDNFQCNNIHGFVSIDSNDSIKNMSLNYYLPNDVPVYGINNSNLSLTNLADTFSNSLTLGIQSSIKSSIGPINGYTDYYFHTGSNSNGTWNSNNCQGYTTNSSSIRDTISYNGDTGMDWLKSYDNPCHFNMNYLCICY